MTQGFSFDIIVVGVGAMGAATCHALARRGVRVLGLERFDVPHGLGSSGGQTRLVRLAYYEHPDYVPLLRRAYEMWDALAEEAGVPLLHRTGALYLGRPEGQLVGGSLQAARQHGLAHEVLDAAAVEQRFGAFRVPEHFAVMYEPEAGFVLAERAVATFADRALRHGAELHGREPVRSWQADRTGVRVVTDRGTYQAGHVVFTAGAWTGPLVRQLGIPLTVTRQVVGWVWPRTPERFALGHFPCWAIEDDAPGFQGIYYGFPLMSGVPMESPGIKARPGHASRRGRPRHHDRGRGRLPPRAGQVPARRRRPAAVHARVHVHHEPGPALRDRPPSRARQRHHRLRLQRSRLQAGAGHGRGPGRSGHAWPQRPAHRLSRPGPLRALRRARARARGAAGQGR
jgi:monomeric sarcosine oxidase